MVVDHFVEVEEVVVRFVVRFEEVGNNCIVEAVVVRLQLEVADCNNNRMVVAAVVRLVEVEVDIVVVGIVEVGIAVGVVPASVLDFGQLGHHRLKNLNLKQLRHSFAC